MIGINAPLDNKEKSNSNRHRKNEANNMIKEMREKKETQTETKSFWFCVKEMFFFSYRKQRNRISERKHREK